MSNSSKKKKRQAVKAQARQAHRSAQRPGVDPEKLRAALNGIGTAAKAFAARQGAPDQFPEGAANTSPPGMTGQLPWPDEQTILEDPTLQIVWRWVIGSPLEDTLGEAVVSLVRYPTGNFMVSVKFPSGAKQDVENFDPEIAKGLGEALLGAYAWRNVWEDFSGRYIANGGRKPVDEPYEDRVVIDEALRLADVDPSPHPIGTHFSIDGTPISDDGGEVIYRGDIEGVIDLPNGIPPKLGPVPNVEPQVPGQTGTFALSRVNGDGTPTDDCICLGPPAPPGAGCPVHPETPYGMNPEWCLGGGQFVNQPIDEIGTIGCPKCRRNIKPMKNGKLPPHKKVVK